MKLKFYLLKATASCVLILPAALAEESAETLRLEKVSVASTVELERKVDSIENRIDIQLAKEIAELERSEKWLRVSRERFVGELYRRLTKGFGDEKFLEIAVEILRYFPDDVSVISQIAVGYDPAHAVSIARKLTDKAEELNIPLRDPSSIARSIAKVVPFHGRGLSRIASSVASSREYRRAAENGKRAERSDSVSAVSSFENKKSGSTSNGQPSTFTTPESIEKEEISKERQFRIPDAPANRFHTSP
jgi:hypothetical protein